MPTKAYDVATEVVMRWDDLTDARGVVEERKRKAQNLDFDKKGLDDDARTVMEARRLLADRDIKDAKDHASSAEQAFREAVKRYREATAPTIYLEPEDDSG